MNGGSYGGLYGYTQSTGTQRFFVGKSQVDGWTPTYYNGKLYASVGSTFVQHNPLTGATEWSLSVAGNGAVSAIADGRAFLTGSTLTAIDLTSRTKAWSVTGSFGGYACAADGVVYAISGSTVKAYNAANGTFLRNFTADTSLQHQPIITDDALIVASGSATYVFHRGSGALVQKINVGGQLSLANGTLYIAGGGGLLSTFRVQSPGPAPSAPDLTAASDSGVSSTDNITNNNVVTVTGTALPGATVALYIDGDSVGTVNASGGGAWLFTTPVLTAGTHAIEAAVVSGSGGRTAYPIR